MQPKVDENDLIQKLRQVGLRATNQRLAVMKNLAERKSHLSAEEVYNCLKPEYPTLSLSTVYKTLQVMSQVGTISSIETGVGSLKFDGQTHPHHHAICRKCGKIQNVDVEMCSTPPSSETQIEGFSIKTVKVYFTGLCEDCQKEELIY